MKGRKISKDVNNINKDGNSLVLSFVNFWKASEGSTVVSLSLNPSRELPRENHPQGRMDTAGRRNGSHDPPLWDHRIGSGQIMLGLDTSRCCHTPDGINQVVSFMGKPLARRLSHSLSEKPKI